MRTLRKTLRWLPHTRPCLFKSDENEIKADRVENLLKGDENIDVKVCCDMLLNC